MAEKSAKRNAERTGQRAHNYQQARLDLSNRKRHRAYDIEENDNTHEHRRKSPKITDKEDDEQLQNPSRFRRGPPKQGTQSGKQTERERLTEVSNTKKQFQRRYWRSSRVLQQDRPRSLKAVDAYHSDTAQAGGLETSKVQKGTKWRHTSDNGNDPHVLKRSRYDSGQVVEPSALADKEELIKDWVNQSCERHFSGDEKQSSEVLANMAQVPRRALPSPEESSESSTVIFRRSERSTVSTHDTDYRQSMRHRNIYIERESAPSELMKRAHQIISRPRATPEMDDQAVQELKDKSRRLQEDAEDEIIQQLALGMIPAMSTFPDPRLARNANQLWSDAIPIPLDASILTNPLPLPTPKPGLAFGYSQTAFTRDQLRTIDLLVDDQSGRSYAIPDQKLYFPFLGIEFKSQAKNGTHYIATNQAAGAGAIAINGKLDLVQRSFGLESFDYDEPQFFSVTMDHELARVNVHWLQAPASGGQHSFHVESLSKHLLDDPIGIRAVARAIKNILDYGTDVRLRSVCDALEAYRAVVARDRKTAIAQAQKAGTLCRPEVRKKRPPKSAPPDDDDQYPLDTVALRSSNSLPPTQRYTKSRTPGANLIAPPKRTRLTQQVDDNDDKAAHLAHPTRIPATANVSKYEKRQSHTTQSSSRAPPMKVFGTRVEISDPHGWLFELQGQHIFVPEHRWQRTVRAGRPAQVNFQYNVWCYDDETIW